MGPTNKKYPTIKNSCKWHVQRKERKDDMVYIMIDFYLRATINTILFVYESKIYGYYK